MQCPECGHTNVAGSLFCEKCGSDLQQAAPPREPTGKLRPAAVAPEEFPCPACGHRNAAGHEFCEGCGKSLAAAAAEEPQPEPERRIETTVQPAAPAPPAPAAATSALAPGQLVTGPRMGAVKLVVEQGMVVGKQFLLSAPEMLVGREDAGDQIFPDLDLSGLDEGFVHRRHALLCFEGSFLFVTHLGGHNRTYVNNRPIADRLPHPLNIGDTVRFGKVMLRVTEA